MSYHSQHPLPACLMRESKRVCTTVPPRMNRAGGERRGKEHVGADN